MLGRFARLIPRAKQDPIMGLTEKFKKDTHSKKINLSIGAYRDEYGKPYVLDTVKKAKQIILDSDHEYSGIVGCNRFNTNTVDFGLGKGNYNPDKIATVQTISGTGACRLAAEFISRFTSCRAYLSYPTWANHIPIMQDAGLQTGDYHYIDGTKLDLDGMLSDLDQIPLGNLVVLHMCGHNPTGIDPTLDQWKEIFRIIKLKQHVPLFDAAYQGFVSGDPVVDSYPIRFFNSENYPFILAQSYSKNFGLYGERVGALSFINIDRDIVLSQLKKLIRPMYSNPPINGAKIINTIMESDTLYSEWNKECLGMAKRMTDIRFALRDRLTAKSLSDPDRWEYLTVQRGMFGYTDFSPEMIDILREEYHIYMTSDGRISIAGINYDNIDYLVDSITECLQ